MKVLATGPESSGTRYLAALLAAGGAEAVHRSQPHGPDWVDVVAMLDDFDAVVVVIRGLMAHRGSCIRHGIDVHRRRKALARLAPIFGDERVTVVTYESLAVETERRWLLSSLGLDPEGAAAQPWTDENVKHYP